MSRASKAPVGVVVGLVAAAMWPLAACNSDAEVDVGGPMTVNNDVLESQVRAKVAKDLGGQAPPVNCPNELDARRGATTICTMTRPDGTYNITVTVTEMDWGDVILDDGSPGNVDDTGNARFDVKVADKPNP
jgi:hypothetical protein